MIPYSRQSIDDSDIEAVAAVLRSPWLTQGPMLERFERAVAAYCGAKYAIAVSSATAALHLACLALNLESGQTVWTSPNTFVASANCARYCGANVDFVDIDKQTYNLCAKELASKLEAARDKQALPKIVIPVHFAGQSSEMEAIAELAKKFNFAVIEDASHALGAAYQNEKVGSCRFSDMTVFSFHAVKIITTGEGGMITTNSAELNRSLRLLRSHGITRDTAQMERGNEGAWFYEQNALGFNFRMTDIQAALGLSQITKLDAFVERRNQLAANYDQRLQGLPLILPWRHGRARSAFHLYVVQLKLRELSRSRRQIFEELRAAGVGVNVHYIPVYLHPYYRAQGFAAGICPHAEEYYNQAISLPLHPELSEIEQEQVISSLRRVLQ